jgi:hypothetical protein
MVPAASGRVRQLAGWCLSLADRSSALRRSIEGGTIEGVTLYICAVMLCLSAINNLESWCWCCCFCRCCQVPTLHACNCHPAMIYNYDVYNYDDITMTLTKHIHGLVCCEQQHQRSLHRL